MKIYKKINVPAIQAHEKTVFCHTECDRCGTNVEDQEDIYEIKKVEISSEIGNSYPEGGSSTFTEIDCCYKCFKEIVIPALKKCGFKEASTIEKDW